MLDSGENLQKHLLGLEVVSNVMALFGDLGEQVAFRTILNHNIRAIRAVQDLDEGNNIGVIARGVMKLDLSVLELPLASIETDLVQCLDGVLNISHDVAGSVNGSICANAKDCGQLDVTSQYQANVIFWAA